MKNYFVFVFVIYCVGVKLWTHINICIMYFVFFVIYMYAEQKEGGKSTHKNKKNKKPMVVIPHDYLNLEA